MDFAVLQGQLAAIREKFYKLINRIIEESRGEAFYGRIFLINGREIIGLIENLSINEHKITFDFIQEKLVKGKLKVARTKKAVSFEEIARIDVFKTKSGKPLFVGE